MTDLNDYLTPERVQLLDAIKSGDVASIRALTDIDWNFVYPPATLTAEAAAERAAVGAIASGEQAAAHERTLEVRWRGSAEPRESNDSSNGSPNESP